MKSLSRKPLWALTALMILTVGCTLSLAPTPTPFVFPTPNMTLTALFTIPSTATAAPLATLAPVPFATATPVSCTGTNLAQFVSETIPDGTVLTPGAAFTKTWTLSNVGTCTWTTSYNLVFDSGSQLSAPASVPLTAPVAPGGAVTLSANMVAPTTVGYYQGYWKISTDQGTRFGVGTGGATAFWVTVYAGTPAPVCSVPSNGRRPDSHGGMPEAYFTTTPPTIDGNLASFSGEWPSSLSWSANHIVYGASNWSGSSDLSGTYHLKWDSENLYLAARVVDNNYVQESTGSNLYNGDSLEILLDTNLKGDYCSSVLNSDDYQLGISGGFAPGSGTGAGPQAYLWFPKDKAGGKPVVTIAAASAYSPAGYVIEAKIPWDVFGMGVAPSGAEKYGFALSISDNDATGTSKQQSMSSSDPYRVLTNPMTWGTLQIEVKAGP